MHLAAQRDADINSSSSCRKPSEPLRLLGFRFFFVLCALSCAGALPFATAIAAAPADPVLNELLDESTPSAFSPNDFDAEDFAIEWVGASLGDIKAQIGTGTLQWVRVSEVLVLPRGRLVLTSPSGLKGSVSHVGRTQFFSPVNGGAATQAEIPIALVANEQNRIEITLDSGRKAELRVVFRPRTAIAQNEQRAIFLDTSCSRLGLDVTGLDSAEVKNTSWMYLGCRLIHVKATGYNTAAVELYAHLANTKATILANGVDTSPVSPGVWRFNIHSAGSIKLAPSGTNGQTVTITYNLPKVDPRGFLGLGLGPYAYTIVGGDLNTNKVIPLTTLYGSYRISETARITAFDATALHYEYYTDVGLYLNAQSIRTLDQRLIFNVMLGAHVLGFKERGNLNFRPSAPQGVEFILTDFLKRQYNLSLGGFLYPTINDKSYYNLWVRWGSAKFFIEWNYISWRDTTGGERQVAVYSRSAGISLGVPLFNFQ